MLDKLIDLLVKFIALGQIYTFVDEFDRGVVLRCGRYHRNIGPGLRWLIPFAFERAITVNVKPEPMDLGVQSLHTSDDFALNIQVWIIQRIVDEHQYLIEIENPDESIAAACCGLISDTVSASTWKALNAPGSISGLKSRMNRRANKRGSKIIEVHVQSFSCGDATRLWHEGIEF